MIEVKNVVKNFGGFRALDGMCLSVPKGSIYGLVGPNGAGKTTIINHLTGVYFADSGSVLIDGEEIAENSDLKQRVLCINDEWYFYPSFSTKEMARLYERLYKNFNRERFERLAEILPIDENRQIRRLSKGMKKQVAFRLVLSCMPEVLILDEPLDGLDPVMRKQIMNVIISDVAERGMTVLVSSHNLRELEDICDHVGIIHKGKMVLEKPLEDLKGNICKIQLAFNGEFPEALLGDEILHTSKLGSVYTLIVKGDPEAFEKKAREFSPLIFDKVSLTLEEVFIYELG
ncbi:MAG: ABC transporter ATP-binding protein, partial [Oscillospiraceae bacterium]|nr:ABC transporter ATP-binding protein [Oscillospiraceae bacterium]